jgi:predicted amidophosphoribosyltransferase
MKYLKLSLKICEGCGALWLRQVSIDGVYCVRCARKLSSFAAAKGKHGGGRPSRSGRVARRCTNGRFAGGDL